MPANSSGWLFHCMARETGRIGHLFSPNQQRQTFPWFPYALDNGAFSCWDMRENQFDLSKWKALEDDWKRLLIWSQSQPYQARWAIVPDVIGNREATLEQWDKYAKIVQECKIPLAIAVQDGMTRDDVRSLSIQPEVIAIGGTTDWKWETVEMWARAFPRVHVLRCNSPQSRSRSESDGTGERSIPRHVKLPCSPKITRRIPIAGDCSTARPSRSRPTGCAPRVTRSIRNFAEGHASSSACVKCNKASVPIVVASPSIVGTVSSSAQK